YYEEIESGAGNQVFGRESRDQTEVLVYVTAPNLPTALRRVRVHDGRMDARHLHRLAYCPCGNRRSRPASVYLGGAYGEDMHSDRDCLAMIKVFRGDTERKTMVRLAAEIVRLTRNMVVTMEGQLLGFAGRRRSCFFEPARSPPFD